MRTRLLTTCRPTATDAHLARRASAGDDDAFEKLYVRYQPRLEAYCRSIVRHDEDARDAVQSAMTKALVALRRDHPSNVQGWLFRIAHNEAISLLRRRRPTTELADVLHDDRLGPAGDLLLREELRATLEGVRALPGHLQHPLLLRELAGLSYGQVADVVGGTPAAARKAVFDARTALSADRAGRDEACSVIRQSLSEGDGRRRRARVVRSHLQSCRACCEWESAQRQRRHHLAALLPAASAVGSTGGWLAGLFGGGSTVAAGVTGSLATNAKIAASLAVIAAGAAPVVEQVEHTAKPAPKASASAGAGAGAKPAVAAAHAARGAVTAATATRAAAAASLASARRAAGTAASLASARSAAAATTRRASASDTLTDRDATRRGAANETSAGRDSTARPHGATGDTSTAQRGTGDAAAGPRTKDAASGRGRADASSGAGRDPAHAAGTATFGARDQARGHGSTGPTPPPGTGDASGGRQPSASSGGSAGAGTSAASRSRPRQQTSGATSARRRAGEAFAASAATAGAAAGGAATANATGATRLAQAGTPTTTGAADAA